MPKSDFDIVKSIQKWDSDSFIFLYEKYSQKIFDFVFYKVGKKQDAEDITSETFLKAFDKIDSFDLTRKSLFSSRLYSIASNLTIDHFRQNKIDYPEYSRLEDQSVENDILQTIQDRDQLNQIFDFLDEIGKDKKEIFILRVWNEMSYEEISQIIGKSANACKVSFHRTLQTVIQRFGYLWLLILLTNIP